MKSNDVSWVLQKKKLKHQITIITPNAKPLDLFSQEPESGTWNVRLLALTRNTEKGDAVSK
jgi:hypothetical protein